jgi:hypothetical protein
MNEAGDTLITSVETTDPFNSSTGATATNFAGK